MLSKSNIKYIQSLQHKKFRDEYQVFMAEGPKVVNELLRSGVFECKRIFALEEWVNSQSETILNIAGNNLEQVEQFELEKIAFYTTPNQVVAIFSIRKPIDKIEVNEGITLVLDNIKDPGNFGTIIRTADWFGIKNIVCSEDTVDMYNNKVVQSTMASLARVNILYVNLPEWLNANNMVPVIAATLDGIHPDKVKNSSPMILIIGNESNGIRPEILEMSDKQVTIPRIGHAESLNAAVATGILLHALTQ